jgi:acetoin utilization deacetylase AcuC-like enzyme
VIAFCSHPRFVEHITGPGHPERPDRVRAIHRAVRQAKMITSPDPFLDFNLDLGTIDGGGVKLVELEAQPAEEKWFAAVHSSGHIEHVRSICAAGGGMLDPDTYVDQNSYEIALLSLGAVLRCCDAVVGEEVKRAFAAVRPPGHHAEPDRAMGFCLFSNVAIAARYLQQKHGQQRIAIVDFDVHHGNGTQAAFEADPTVLFISLHQHPRTCYPGTGYETEVGTGAGRGYTMNIPFRPGAGDQDYLQAFDRMVIPKLDEFRPQMLLTSAGFDAHTDDPLAQIDLSDECFELMTRKLAEAANRHCDGRIVSALEGGYNLRALGRSVVRHLIGLNQ